MSRKPFKLETRKQILDIIRERAPITRPFLAKKVRLTPAAVSLHVTALIDDGLVAEVGYAESIGGRMPAKIDLARKENCTLGFALHDGDIVANVADFDDRSLLTERVSVAPGCSRHELLGRLDEVVQKSLSVVARRKLRQRQCLLAISGGFDSDGRITRSAHFPQLDGFPIRDYLRDEFDLPCEVVHDTHALFCGMLDVPMRRQRVALITWTTGIAWTQAKGESLEFTNANPGVSHIAHFRVKPVGGRPCSCGQTGCLEAEFSGPALAAKLAETGKPKYQNLTLARLADLARQGDPVVVDLLSESAEAIGRHLSAAVFLFAPEYLRIATILGLDEDLLIRRLKEGLAYRIHPSRVDAMDIAKVPDINDALTTGMCRLARSMFFDTRVAQRLKSES